MRRASSKEKEAAVKKDAFNYSSGPGYAQPTAQDMAAMDNILDGDVWNRQVTMYEHGIRTAQDPSVGARRALQKLQEGNDRFTQGNVAPKPLRCDHREALKVHGQRPMAAVIGCADSRCSVEVLFDAMPGDLFVLRNAGNTLMMAEASFVGSAEYAVCNLGANLIMVLGHTHCGAIKGATQCMLAHKENPPDKDAPRTTLENLLGAMEPVAAQAQMELGAGASLDDIAAHAVYVNVFHSIENLFAYSDPLTEKVRSGDLEVHAAIYDIVSGKVEFLGQHPRLHELIGFQDIVDDPLDVWNRQVSVYEHGVRTAKDDAIVPGRAIEKLQEGNMRFLSGTVETKPFLVNNREALKEHGQRPMVCIIGCADSRCSIEVLFDAMPGDIFVLRNAGNTLTQAEASFVGSAEYSVLALGAKCILVLGHTHCGAIKGATQCMLDRAAGKGHDKSTSALMSLLGDLEPVAAHAQAELAVGAKIDEIAAHAIYVNIFHSIEKLLQYSDGLREKCLEGELEVHGAVYDIVSGKVDFLGQHPRMAQLLAHPTL